MIQRPQIVLRSRRCTAPHGPAPTRTVLRTEAGEFLLPRAQRLLLEAEELKIRVRIFARGYTRFCRIGFGGTATYRMMREVIRPSKTKLPHVYVHMQGEMLTPQIETAVNQRELDVALMSTPGILPIARNSASIVFSLVF